MALLDFTHGGDIYDPEGSKRPIIDFSANINPLGIPDSAKEALTGYFDDLLHYPDTECRRLRRVLSKLWGVDTASILMGCGSTELIYTIIFALKPERVFIPSPTFTEYERAARLFKTGILFLPLQKEEGFILSPPKMEVGDVLFICNPNNPTGNILYHKKDMASIPDKGTVVVDEAFMDFVVDEHARSLIESAGINKGLIVIRTFTKIFSIPGLRIGSAIAHPDTIKILKTHMIPWSVNSMAQAMVEIMLEDRGYIEETKRYIEKERQYLFNGISGIGGLTPYPSIANYLLVRIEKEGLTSIYLRESLLKKGIMIRDCRNFRGLGLNHIRIAIRKHEENETLISALKEAI